jgi:hypothetical protein
MRAVPQSTVRVRPVVALELLRLSEQTAPLDEKLEHPWGHLTPYATQFRYPGGPMSPPAADADQAVRLAQDVVSFVRGRLVF